MAERTESPFRERFVMQLTPRAQQGPSIPTLRNWILLALLVGVSAYTTIMFGLSRDLSERFGPQVRQDLEWRVQRGAVELSKACELAVAIGDVTEIEKCFGPYAEASDVQALVVTDADGKAIVTHGKAPEGDLFSGAPGAVAERANALVSWRPVQIEGADLGKLAVVVSLDRLRNAEDLLSRSSLATLVGGLGGLLFGALVVVFFTRAVGQRDAALSNYAANLEGMVAERTAELDARNRGMRLVLDNVAQGFITIDFDGVMASERSAIVDTWFGEPTEGQSLADYLERVSPNAGLWLDIGLEQLRDDLMPADLVIDQMPSRIETTKGIFKLSYQVLEDGNRILVIISDVTEAVAHERAEREQRELVALFQRISVDRAGVEEFVTEAAGLVQALRTEQDATLQRRLVHTLKGNCGIYGLETYAALAHEIESEMIDSGEALREEQREQLVSMWKDAMLRVGQLMGTSREGVLEVRESELEEVRNLLLSGAPVEEALRRCSDWRLEPIERRLERLGQQAVVLARRMGKPEPVVAIDGHGVRLRGEGWSPLFTTLVHLVRNAMDHGIEGPLARTEAGKAEAGRLSLSAERNGSLVTLMIADDGAGIDFDRITEKAAAQGLPTKTRDDLVAALFADGLSTREAANDISGRGVGMAAVRQVVLESGGQVDVRSERGKGTTFVLTLDERRMTGPSASGARISASLIPQSVGAG